MKNNYSVDEILNAIDELQKIKKEKKILPDKKSTKIDTTSIPKDTLRLIEEAEKYKN
jgi:hypothetical protein|tara:strand:- start:80 stop:250 length:171 start_codon:yes stop_codon:yes gene_type:complete